MCITPVQTGIPCPQTARCKAAASLHGCTLGDGLAKAIAIVVVSVVPCACRSMASDLQAPSSRQAAPVGLLPNPFNAHQPSNADQLNLQGEDMRGHALH